MRRRDFLTLVGAAAAWPLTAGAQQPNNPTIGYFSGRSSTAEEQYRAAFHRGLEESDFVEGRNVAIEYRFSDGQDDRLPSLAADLVQRQVAVLVAMDAPSALAAKGATKTIPIVFSTGVDPVTLGLVESLNRPVGNATGISTFVTELGPKRLQLVREVVPHARLIAYVVNLNTVNGPRQLREMERAAKATGQQILVLSAATEDQLNEAFATIVKRKADAVVYSASVFFQVMGDQLVNFAARHSIPAIYEWPEFVKSGGLISYSSNRAEAGRQIGIYTGKILKGAKIADLPVTQSTKFELVINLKAAKAMGLTIPAQLLARADEVIE